MREIFAIYMVFLKYKATLVKIGDVKLLKCGFEESTIFSHAVLFKYGMFK